MDPLGPDNLPEHLAAWAEGALDDGRTAELRRYLADHPRAWDAIDQGRRLAGAARRALSSGAAPAALRDRIAAAARPRPRQLPAGRPVRWYATAAAVLLAVGVGLIAGRLMPRPAAGPVAINPAAGPVVPAAVVAHVGAIHSNCARVADRLHAAGYPADLGPLAADVDRDLHADHPWPDLTAAEFRYVGAGPCGSTLPDAVHLLYKSTRPGSYSAASLFVQGYHGQYPMTPGHLYTLSAPTDPFPVLAWRTDRVVYFLLADDASIEERVLGVISTAPARK